MPDGQVTFDAIEDGDFEGLDSYKNSLGGLKRRDFLKYCTGIAAALGVSPALGIRIANAATQAAQRPPVIWLSGQACTGCTESLLRAHHPTLDTLILDQISLDYHETLNIGSGHQAEAFKKASIEANYGKYILVVDGSIPLGQDGIYCKVANETILESVQKTAEGAAAVIAMGSCASWGGIPSSGPNPTEAVGVHEVVTGKPVINIPGCPPSPYNFLATALHVITFGTLPELDDKGRPKFAYGRLVHENCERRAHFNAGRFALDFGDDGHRLGYCLYKLGCKGPETYANCPTIGFNDNGEGSWPVGTGSPCFGCSEKGVGFTKPIHSLADVQLIKTPEYVTPGIVEDKGVGASVGSAAVVAGIAGAAIGAGGVIATRLGKAPTSGTGDGSDTTKTDA